MNYKPGDVVQLRSGGPPLTVVEVWNEGVSPDVPVHLKVLAVSWNGTLTAIDSLPVDCVEPLTKGD